MPLLAPFDSMFRFVFALLRNIFAFLWFLWSSFWHKIEYLTRRKKKLYLSADLEDDYEFGPPGGFARLLHETPSFLELRETLERVRDADSIDGLVLKTDGLEMGTARVHALTGLVDEIRESGKHVVAHARMPMTSEYLLASAADDILLPPSGRLYTFGPRFDQFFGARALERLDVVPQMIHIGDFKTAAHRLVHDEMTVPQASMMRALHDSMVGQLRERFARRRSLDESEGEVLFEEAPADAETALREEFVDHLVFRTRIEAWLRWGSEISPTVRPPFKGLEGWEKELDEQPSPPEPDDEAIREEGDEIEVYGLENADRVLPPEYDWTPLTGPTPRIGVVDLTGMIVMPDMGIPGGRAPVVDPEPLLPTLREIRTSGLYDGLVLHINSPGGSALASDIIWEAVQEIRAIMPVAAYCTDVAGSGGYYLAVSADHVVCHPMSLTGSIGVVTGKVSAPDLADRLGIDVASIYDRDADTFTSPVHPLSDAMLERMNEDARSFYRRFLQRVGQNRDLSRRRLHRYARGRVYLGADAHRRGLVDELGSLGDALDAVRRMAGLELDEGKIAFVPHREQDIRKMLGMQMSVESLVPEELAQPLAATRILERENMLALMPLSTSWER